MATELKPRQTDPELGTLTPAQEKQLKALVEEMMRVKRGQGDIFDKATSMNPEQTRLKLVGKLAEGSATLQRPTARQVECYATIKAFESIGIEMRATSEYMRHNFEMSPGVDGKGIDGLIKVVTPVPSTAILGAAKEEERGPGAIARLLAWVMGGKKEETK
jgi:hypothetical protein